MAQTSPNSLPLLIEQAGSPKAEICKFSEFQDWIKIETAFVKLENWRESERNEHPQKNLASKYF